MAIELIRYYDGKPVMQDGLKADVVPIKCPDCGAEYRIHHSDGELKESKAALKLRLASQVIVSRSHTDDSPHPASLKIIYQAQPLPLSIN